MTCGRTDKLRYPRRKDAAYFAAAARARTAERITPYHCPRCHCWHIGHPPEGRSTMATGPRPVTVNCPACEAVISIPIALNLEPERDEDGALVITLDPDYGPIEEHCRIHA